MFVPAYGMSRIFLGWILCCSFFTAQTHAQRERLHRAQVFAPAVAQCESGQPQPLADHLGCSTTRALKPSSTPARFASSTDRGTSSILSSIIEPAGHRAQPLPVRAAQRPVLRI